MKRSRFSESQIIKISKKAEAGVPLTDLCQIYSFNRNSFCKWKARYGGMETSGLRQLRKQAVLLPTQSPGNTSSPACYIQCVPSMV
ncbi:MAG: transposase [Anaerolineales bacterium]|nr:transposase [Anaerolineales bacterium]